MKNKIAYYITAVIVFLTFKFIYTYTTTQDLFFLLKPTNTLVSLVTNSHSNFTESGFYHEKLNILLDKSCSGFNFWMLCFLMLTFLGIKHTNKMAFRLFVVPVILIISYVITLFVNTSRILFSIVLQNQFNQLSINKIIYLHQAEGVFIYLTFLILIYLVLEYLLKKTNYAKLT